MALFGNPFDALQDSWRDIKGSFSKHNYGDPVAHIGRNLVPEFQMSKFAGDKIFGDSKIGNLLNKASNFYGEDQVNKNISGDILDRYHINFKKPGTAIGILASGYGVGAGLGGGSTAIPSGPSTAELMAAGPAGGSGAGAGAAGGSVGFDWQSALKYGSALGGGGQSGEQPPAAYQREMSAIQPSQGEPNWNALLAQPQQQPQQSAQPAPATTWSDRLMSNLNSPQAQLALRILANNRGGASFGNVIGQSGVEQSQANAQAQQAQLQQRVAEAQLKRLEQPDTHQQNVPASVAEFQFAKQNGFKGSFEDWVTAGGQTSRPSSVQEWEFFQKLPKDQQKLYLEMKRNPNMSVQTIAGVPNVVAPSNLGTSVVPLSTEQKELDARNRAAAAQSSGSTTGTATATARMELPQAIATAEQGVQNINDLLAAEGFPRIFGLQGSLPIIPGSKRADAKALLEQVQGQVFLQAYESLKGSGQITEIEGEKAEKAKARLQKAQSYTAAEKALKELRDIVMKGVERARKKAGVSPEGGNVVDYKDLP
jgi:hypothetical protein